MSLVIGSWSVVIGLVAVLRPSFCYKAAELSPESINRNNRIARVGGTAILLAGAAVLTIELLGRR